MKWGYALTTELRICLSTSKQSPPKFGSVKFCFKVFPVSSNLFPSHLHEDILSFEIPGSIYKTSIINRENIVVTMLSSFLLLRFDGGGAPPVCMHQLFSWKFNWWGEDLPKIQKTLRKTRMLPRTIGVGPSWIYGFPWLFNMFLKENRAKTVC